MSVLWLATAADAASASGGQTVDCSLAVGSEYMLIFTSKLLLLIFATNPGTESMLCHTYQAIEAFGFLNWLIR